MFDVVFHLCVTQHIGLLFFLLLLLPLFPFLLSKLYCWRINHLQDNNNVLRFSNIVMIAVNWRPRTRKLVSPDLAQSSFFFVLVFVVVFGFFSFLFWVICEDISAPTQLFTQQTTLKETQISSNDQRTKKRVYFSCICCWVTKHFFCFDTEISSHLVLCVCVFVVCLGREKQFVCVNLRGYIWRFFFLCSIFFTVRQTQKYKHKQPKRRTSFWRKGLVHTRCRQRQAFCEQSSAHQSATLKDFSAEVMVFSANNAHSLPSVSPSQQQRDKKNKFKHDYKSLNKQNSTV